MTTFDNIIQTWRKQGKMDDAQRADEALRLLHAQVVANLNADAAVNAHLEQLLLALIGVDATVAAMKAAFEKYCRLPNHKFIGATSTTAAVRVLGHIVSSNNLDDAIHASGMLPTDPTDPSIVESLLLKSLARQKRQLNVVKLRKHCMWSFHDDSSVDDPFANAGFSVQTLRRRLGLGRYHFNTDELLCFSHRLPAEITPYLPTAFDAEDYQYFRPIGKTWPLDNADDGFPEVVHSPIHGENLVAQIRRCTV